MRRVRGAVHLLAGRAAMRPRADLEPTWSHLQLPSLGLSNQALPAQKILQFHLSVLLDLSSLQTDLCSDTVS